MKERPAAPTQESFTTRQDLQGVGGVPVRGVTDHKAHGSDHVTVFESRIGSFFGGQTMNIHQYHYCVRAEITAYFSLRLSIAKAVFSIKSYFLDHKGKLIILGKQNNSYNYSSEREKQIPLKIP